MFGYKGDKKYKGANIKDKIKEESGCGDAECQCEEDMTCADDEFGDEREGDCACEEQTGSCSCGDNAVDSAVEHYKRQSEENHDKYLRALAELDNFKKRSIKERADLIKYSGENLARDILNIVDDLERALNSACGGTSEGFLDGIKLIADNLVSTLKKHQIEGEPSVGKPFDPQKHEAMATVPTADCEPGTVIEEIKKLYLFKDKVLRVGQVVVAKETE